MARLPVSPTDVSETEKIEGFRTSLATQSPALGGIAPEFNQARLLWVEFQTELHHALLQFQQKQRGVFSMLKPQHGVSRRGELHPQALAEPYLNVSAHTAPII